MGTTYISTKELVQYYTRLKKRYNIALKKGLNDGAIKSIAILRKATINAIPANPDYPGRPGTIGAHRPSGTFLKNWYREWIGPMAVKIKNPTSYAPTIEYGRAAGTSPPANQAIERWLIARLGFSSDEAKHASFPIARAIGRRGLLPRHILRNSVPAIEGMIMKAINEEIAKELERSPK
jgi:hypothetical protein